MHGTASVILSIVVAACAADTIAVPTVVVEPREALTDQRVTFKIVDAEPGQRLTLTARATDGAKRRWESTATFNADDHGTVDLDLVRPQSGSYAKPDAMGLFWSMSPVDGRPGGLFNRDGISSYAVEISLSSDAGAIGSAEVTRQFFAPGVTTKEIREQGLVGRMWWPPDAGRHPAILLLTGGTGGIQMRYGALLASHGYTVFSLAYFGIDPLPARQVEIPLEYFERAIAWMKSQPGVDPDRIAAMGNSKGAELALLLGSTFPDIKAVIGFAGSSVVWEGAMQRGGAGVIDIHAYKSGWTYHDHPLPYLAKSGSDAAVREVMANPLRSRGVFEPSLADEAGVEKAAIPVERIRGAVLLFSGKDDVAWPSTPMSDAVASRLQRRGHRWPFKHVAYENAGHVFEDGYLPTPAMSPLQGGTAEGNAYAQSSSWSVLLDFLRENLR